MPGMPSTDHDLEVAPGEEQDVTKLELFFDLIYVFAVSQLSEHLLDNLTWRGALETLVMSLTVFGVWATTTYESTMVLSRRRTARYLLMGVMVIGLIMNASITRAFEHSPWMFVAPLLAIQIGRPLLTRRVDVLPAMRLHRINMVVWAAVSAVPWVVGALADEHNRLIWWAAAAIDLLGMRLRHPVPGLPVPGRDEIDFDLPHQIERCQLFLIICLGEAILTTGSAIIHGLDEPLVVVTGVASLLVIIGVWGLFFGPANEEHVLAPMASESHGDDPAPNVSLAILATNGQQVLVEKPGGDQDDSGHSYPEQGVDRLTEHFRPLGPHRDEEGQSACRRGVPQAAGESLEEDVAEIGQDQADNGRALARQGGRGHIHPVAEVDGHPLNALAGLRSDSGRVAQG